MAESTHFQPIVTHNLTATIADAATESGAVDLSGTTLVGVAFPAEFDGTAVTVKAASTSGGTYVNVYDNNGLQLSLTAAASRVITIDPVKTAGLQYIKLVAGTAQTGATVLTLITRPV